MSKLNAEKIENLSNAQVLIELKKYDDFKGKTDGYVKKSIGGTNPANGTEMKAHLLKLVNETASDASDGSETSGDESSVSEPKETKKTNSKANSKSNSKDNSEEGVAKTVVSTSLKATEKKAKSTKDVKTKKEVKSDESASDKSDAKDTKKAKGDKKSKKSKDAKPVVKNTKKEVETETEVSGSDSEKSDAKDISTTKGDKKTKKVIKDDASENASDAKDKKTKSKNAKPAVNTKKTKKETKKVDESDKSDTEASDKSDAKETKKTKGDKKTKKGTKKQKKEKSASDEEESDHEKVTSKTTIKSMKIPELVKELQKYSKYNKDGDYAVKKALGDDGKIAKKDQLIKEIFRLMKKEAKGEETSSEEEKPEPKEKKTKAKKPTESGEGGNDLINQKIQQIVKMAKTDKSIESQCDSKWWVKKFKNDDLMVMKAQTSFKDWVKHYRNVHQARTDSAQMLIVGTISCFRKEQDQFEMHFELDEETDIHLPENISMTCPCNISIQYSDVKDISTCCTDKGDKWAVSITSTNQDDSQTEVVDWKPVSYKDVVKTLTQIIYQAKDKSSVVEMKYMCDKEMRILTKESAEGDENAMYAMADYYESIVV